MQELTKDEMKKIMGGQYDAGNYVVSCSFDPGYSGSFGTCTGGTKDDCQQKADDWCGKDENHCISCNVR